MTTDIGFVDGGIGLTFTGLTREAIDHEIHFYEFVVALMVVFIAVASMTRGI